MIRINGAYWRRDLLKRCAASGEFGIPIQQMVRFNHLPLPSYRCNRISSHQQLTSTALAPSAHGSGRSSSLKELNPSVGSMEANKKSEEIISSTSPKLAGTVNWCTATFLGICAGMLFGGGKETIASAKKDVELLLKLESIPDKREQHRLMTEATQKSFIRITRSIIVGGVSLGMPTAAFYGLQNLLAKKRGVHDVFNVVGAGSATAATYGLILPGSLRWRARNVMLGSVLGAAVCFPVGWIHLKLIAKANEGNPALNPDLDGRGEAKSGVDAAIGRLEGNLKAE